MRCYDKFTRLLSVQGKADNLLQKTRKGYGFVTRVRDTSPGASGSNAGLLSSQQAESAIRHGLRAGKLSKPAWTRGNFFQLKVETKENLRNGTGKACERRECTKG